MWGAVLPWVLIEHASHLSTLIYLSLTPHAQISAFLSFSLSFTLCLSVRLRSFRASSATTSFSPLFTGPFMQGTRAAATASSQPQSSASNSRIYSTKMTPPTPPPSSPSLPKSHLSCLSSIVYPHRRPRCRLLLGPSPCSSTLSLFSSPVPSFGGAW